MWRNLPVRAPRRPSISGRAFQKGGRGAGRHKRQSVPTQSPAQQPPAAVGASSASAANSLDTSAAGAACASYMPAANGSDAPAVDVLDASAAPAAGAAGASSVAVVASATSGVTEQKRKRQKNDSVRCGNVSKFPDEEFNAGPSPFTHE